jgi:S1-C subfamily serine protease
MNPLTRTLWFLCGALVFCGLQSAAHASQPEAIFENAIGYTVKIGTLIETPFAGDDEGAFKGTGFVVDGDKRWILTNAHVVGRSPSRVEVAFRGGEFFPIEDLRRIGDPPGTDALASATSGGHY